MKKRKSHISTIILVIVFFVGLSVMLYPTISDLINAREQKEAIAAYDRTMSSMQESQKEKMLNDAIEYNNKLSKFFNPVETPDCVSGYENILNVTGTGIIGYISIPKIKCELPIYHGTSDAVLNVAVGHIKGSSMPIGGDSTHSVISAHRGLPSAKLFSDLDQMEIGDIFEITVLDQVIKYSVDKISVVYPDDLSKLKIEKGRDLVTLVTCTPYGVNTQRLLVRGKRIYADDDTAIRVESDAFRIEPLIVASVLSIPLLIIIVIFFTSGTFRRRRRRKKLKRLVRKYRSNGDSGGDDIEK